MNTANIKATAELISLVLTIPTLVFAVWVVVIFAPRHFNLKDVWKALKTGEGVSDTQLLLAGICVGFIGAFVDNFYWGIAWGSDFLKRPETDFWFGNGVYPNIFFRQGAGVLAASLHIFAAIRFSKKGQWGYLAVWISAAIGGIGLLLLR